MITQSINLNLVPGGVLPIINVSQYDKGSRTLQIVLFNGVTAYQIPDGSSVTIQGTKADKTGFQYEVDSFSGNVVTTDIEQQMTVFPGDVAIELSIAKNGDRLGTANFILRVEPAALADDTIISETELPLIEQAVEIAEHIAEYVEICEDSATAAAASASTANTKAGEASASATSAASSATSASGSATAAAGSATAAAGSASSASDSATAASGSATSASTSATNAATSETNASGSATSAAASATTASSAANEAHGWCDNNGDSGSAAPSATNNAYYWFTQAQAAASGGDTVTWTQTQASGTKIAEIDISGTSQNVYVPTAPTVNDGVLTIQQDGTTVGTFSANQSGDTTINLTDSSGSTVTWTQTQQTGTKIAEIDIDGTAQDVYAPNYTEGDGIDISNNAISVDTTFTEASTRANIASGDSLSTIWGKIKKWFTDLPNMFVSKTGGTFSGNVTVDSHNGTTSAEGYSALVVGNNIPQGTAGNARGQLLLYGNGSHYALFMPGSLTADRAFDFPDKSGTIALTDDIHEIKASANATVDDLYHYVTPGVYCVYITTSVSPLTAGDLYVLEVFTVKYNNTTTGHVQRLNRVYPVTDAKIFQRVYYGVGGWSAWREV